MLMHSIIIIYVSTNSIFLLWYRLFSLYNSAIFDGGGAKPVFAHRRL